MTNNSSTLNASSLDSSIYVIGSSGRVSVIVRDTSVWGGATVNIKQSGNGTNFGRSGAIRESDREQTRCVVGIVGESVKVSLSNASSGTSIVIDVVTD